MEMSNSKKIATVVVRNPSPSFGPVEKGKNMTRIGIVGTGNMADAYHARKLSEIDDVVVAACCDIDSDKAHEFAAKWGIPEVYSDPREMVKKGSLNGICNVTPDAMHAEISIMAIDEGMSVLCEKPMAVTLDEAKNMVAAVDRADVIHMVNYSKRDFPGLRGAKEILESDEIGRIMHVECSYLQGWLSSMDWEEAKEQPSKLWRLSTAHGSNGDLGDLGCHIYDMTSFLCGDITTISCNLQTSEKPVSGNSIDEYVFDANDGFVSSVRFQNGAVGTIHSTRWASGYRNREFIRIYGDKATLEFDANLSIDQYRYKPRSSEDWIVMVCPSTPNNVQRFIESIRTCVNDPNDFYNGARIQAYLDASVESDKTGCAVAIRI